MILQRDTSDKFGSLDGTASALKRFLQELAELTGIHNDDSMPVLEFRFDDVVARVSQTVNNERHCLSIILQLPRSRQSGYRTRAVEQLLFFAVSMVQPEVLWNADDGCYVVVHYIPTEFFPDEVSILDAILDTSNQARQWHAALCGGEPDGS
ncbi:hypothetical protein ACFQUU_27295 [Herbaspirillum sp. GCM10030257]|uniref:hypothetical protein n=1 Tax=Herbaspirillum sp. GCM10030257 TaxID=3273393 RepID=UPI00360F4F8B